MHFPVWCGDLNYRCDINSLEGKPFPEQGGPDHKDHYLRCKKLVDSGKYEALMNGDQLKGNFFSREKKEKRRKESKKQKQKKARRKKRKKEKKERKKE